MINPRTRSTGVGIAALLVLAACGGDDDASGSGAGSGGSSAGTGGASAEGGGGGGTGGSGHAGSTATGGGSGGASGTSSAGQGGNAGSSTAGSGGASADAGIDAGMMTTATVCKAPVAAAGASHPCPASDPVALELQVVKEGLDTPVFVTSPPGDTERLFVVERGGSIVILDREDFSELGTFITIDGVDASTGDGEKGLLGLAFHPDYPRDPRFFVNFTRQGDMGLETAIASYEVSPTDPDMADPSTEVVLLNYGQPQANHNGGMVVFGPDGCLFIAAGDGGNSNDTGDGHVAGGNGQDLDTHLAKILRIDVDDPSTAAPGNLAGAGNPDIWDYGMRNPWRFSFDRQTGDLYIGDVGQGAVEEVDVEPKGTGNLNYGWPIMEGSQCLSGGCTPPSELVDPVDEYPHGNGDDCVVGGYVYRGSAIPSLQGFYVYGDNGSGRRIRTFTWDGEGRCDDSTIVLSERDGIDLSDDITSFGQDEAGELYVMTKSGVYRIVAQ